MLKRLLFLPIFSRSTRQSTTQAINDLSTQVTDGEEKCLFVTTTTWSSNNPQLFDYESCELHKQTYELKQTAKVLRVGVEVCIAVNHPILSLAIPVDYLLCLRKREGAFYVCPPEEELNTESNLKKPSALSPQQPMLIVKDLPGGTYELQQMDVIRLGRFEVTVKKIVRPEEHLPARYEFTNDDYKKCDTSSASTESSIDSLSQCRICLTEGTIDDPLLSPCKCSGTLQYIHSSCLTRWMSERPGLIDDWERKIFFPLKLDCEVCKAPFPESITVKNRRISLIEHSQPEAPFIVFEGRCGPVAGLFVVSFTTKKEIKVGRSHNSDVRIPDVSISRWHATLRFTNNKFLLEDHRSKFGTLASLRKVYPIEGKHAVSIQIGRTVVNLSIRNASKKVGGILKLSRETKRVGPAENKKTIVNGSETDDSDCPVVLVTNN